MAQDIRDKRCINSKDLAELNFIRHPGPYVFRRHYRCGLRSHIIEVLDPEDVEKENKGIIREGIRWFPKAKPLKILRIFRNKFDSLKDAFEETRRLKIVEKYLAPQHLARSTEFLVDYTGRGKRDVILCGLQEYVVGEILDPWGLNTIDQLAEHVSNMRAKRGIAARMSKERQIQIIRKKAGNFIRKVKKMILEAKHLPDLAGVGNLLLTPAGDIKLVDLNNISKVSFGSTISIDDKGYPVCDKSIEVISLLEQKLLVQTIDMNDAIYRTFLAPQRMREVEALEKKALSQIKSLTDV